MVGDRGIRCFSALGVSRPSRFGLQVAPETGSVQQKGHQMNDITDFFRPYGNYTTFFTPPPHPNCMPAPVFERVPCPHSARHLVVSAATFPQTFGAAFTSEFSSQRKPAPQNQERIFKLLRTGYEALFHLADKGDEDYVLQRTEKDFAKARDEGGMNVGLHVRRGDLHPWEYQYEKDYLPLTQYMDQVREILIDKYEHEEDEENEHIGHNASNGEIEEQENDDEKEDGKIHVHPHKPSSSIPNSSSDLTVSEKRRQKLKDSLTRSMDSGLPPRHGAPGIMASQLFLASDDPDVYSAPEVSRAQRAQDRIILASKSQLEAASNAQKNPWIDEIHGWEGGFYRDQFFGLGREDKDRMKFLGKWKSRIASTSQTTSVMLEDENPDFAEPPTEAAMQMRQMVGRAYLLDLAVLGQSDAVVCAVSASACRILAVIMGWERAIGEDLWKNVDGGLSWRGLVVPED
jgi:hypothetical protein